MSRNLPIGRYAAVAAALAVLMYGAFEARHAAAPLVALEPSAPQAVAHDSPAAAAAVPAAADSPPSATAAINEVTIGAGDTLEAIFRRLALPAADLAAIRSLPGARQRLDLLRTGEIVSITRSPAGDLERLSRKLNDAQTLEVARNDGGGFAATLTDEPAEVRLRTASATIERSLFQAAEDAAMSDTVALKVANVFAWDIDFVFDVRHGDKFTAVYEQLYRRGSHVRDRNLLAAQFVNDGKVYRALRYVGEDGAVGYYTADGKPLRKAFLRAPVDFTRVSSAFNPARFHPILNLIRGHMGTDYAAPSGTPVHAAGDGRVAFEGRRGGYGNAIVLLHANGVSTLYGHMSRFARGVRAGVRVRQGQVIGYVGMTGLATGPHLHYEFLRNGVHLNPQTVRLPGAEPLPPAAMPRFRSAAAPLLDSLAAAAAIAAATFPPALTSLPAPALQASQR